jgi:hypothetical protein
MIPFFKFYFIIHFIFILSQIFAELKENFLFLVDLKRKHIEVRRKEGESVLCDAQKKK